MSQLRECNLVRVTYEAMRVGVLFYGLTYTIHFVHEKLTLLTLNSLKIGACKVFRQLTV